MTKRFTLLYGFVVLFVLALLAAHFTWRWVLPGKLGWFVPQKIISTHWDGQITNNQWFAVQKPSIQEVAPVAASVTLLGIINSGLPSANKNTATLKFDKEIEILQVGETSKNGSRLTKTYEDHVELIKDGAVINVPFASTAGVSLDTAPPSTPSTPARGIETLAVAVDTTKASAAVPSVSAETKSRKKRMLEKPRLPPAP